MSAPPWLQANRALGRAAGGADRERLRRSGRADQGLLRGHDDLDRGGPRQQVRCSAAAVEAGSASANNRTASSVGAMVTSIPRLRRASSVTGSGSSSRTSSRSSRTREWPWARHQFGTTRSGRMIRSRLCSWPSTTIRPKRYSSILAIYDTLSMMPQRDEPGRPRFTPREKVILGLLATDSTSRDVADRLGVSSRKTKRYITRIHSKLEAGAPSRFARSIRHAPRKRRRGKEASVTLQVTAIMLGVEDVPRSKAFYEAIGCAIDQDHPTFVSFNLGEGSSSLALYPRDAAAQDAGVSPEGSGFQGVSFHYIVGSNDEVDEVIGKASNAGGEVVKEASGTQWGYFGYFSDPDGHLWKVATSS